MIDKQMMVLHDKYDKHHIEKKYRIVSSTGNHFSFIGLCECGAFMVCEETYKTGALVNLFTRDKFAVRTRRITGRTWRIPMYKLLEKDEELMSAYKRLPYMNEEYRDKLVNEEIKSLHESEKGYFGRLI